MRCCPEKKKKKKKQKNSGLPHEDRPAPSSRDFFAYWSALVRISSMDLHSACASFIAAVTSLDSALSPFLGQQLWCTAHLLFSSFPPGALIRSDQFGLFVEDASSSSGREIRRGSALLTQMTPAVCRASPLPQTRSRSDCFPRIARAASVGPSLVGHPKIKLDVLGIRTLGRSVD